MPRIKAIERASAEYRGLCAQESAAWARVVAERRAFNDGRGPGGNESVPTQTGIELAMTRWLHTVTALANWARTEKR